MPSAKKTAAPDALTTDLYDQPGHLIRRAHQISVAMFNDVVGQEVTPIQYGILRMVYERPGIDQVSLARLIALDTSTTALTAARLQTKGWLVRDVAEKDRRQLCLSLTPQGEALIRGLVSRVHRMRQKLLGELDAGERELFMKLLKKFVHLNNEQSRAPLRLSQVDGQASAKQKAAKSPAGAAKARKRVSSAA